MSGCHLHRTLTHEAALEMLALFGCPTGGIRARGFSDLRARFVLRDESGRYRRARAPHGSGRGVAERDRAQSSPACQPNTSGDLP